MATKKILYSSSETEDIEGKEVTKTRKKTDEKRKKTLQELHKEKRDGRDVSELSDTETSEENDFVCDDVSDDSDSHSTEERQILRSSTMEQLDKDNHILAQFAGSKSFRCYVGRIMERDWDDAMGTLSHWTSLNKNVILPKVYAQLNVLACWRSTLSCKLFRFHTRSLII